MLRNLLNACLHRLNDHVAQCSEHYKGLVGAVDAGTGDTSNKPSLESPFEMLTVFRKSSDVQEELLELCKTQWSIHEPVEAYRVLDQEMILSVMTAVFALLELCASLKQLGMGLQDLALTTTLLHDAAMNALDTDSSGSFEALLNPTSSVDAHLAVAGSSDQRNTYSQVKTLSDGTTNIDF